MKKKSKSKSPAIPKVDPYLEGLMAKLLERLVVLEKKMDTVITQTSGRFSGGSEPSKPAQDREAQQSQRRERQLYEAICADCHKVCEVPFRPTEVRPVYCKECFAKRKALMSRPGMPVLTPVALPPKAVSKLFETPQAITVAIEKSKKTKKNHPTKKIKKKK